MAQATDNDITTAAAIDDFNAALRHLQDIIGQTDGGVAGDHFSSFDDAEHDWEVSTPKQRADMLREYLEVEAAYAAQ